VRAHGQVSKVRSGFEAPQTLGVIDHTPLVAVTDELFLLMSHPDITSVEKEEHDRQEGTFLMTDLLVHQDASNKP